MDGLFYYVRRNFMDKRFKSFSLFVLLILIFGSLLFTTGCGETKKVMGLIVEVFNREIPGLKVDDCFQTDYIKACVKEAHNIDVEFIPVPRSQEVEKLNILMAAGDAPDLSFTYNVATISNYIKSGGLTDLGPALDKYGKNIKKYLGDEVLQYGVWNGVQYAIPAIRPATAAFSGFIRKDWLDALGLAIPKTTEEFYQVLKAFKEKMAGKTIGKVIPFAINLDENNIDWTSHTLVWSFVQDMPEEEFASKFGQGRWVLPGYKEGIRFLNKLYNEGLLYQDFALDRTGKQYEKEVIQGNIGSFINNFDQPYRQSPGWVFELMKNIPYAEIVPFDPFENYEGKHVKMRYSPNGLLMIVPTFASDKADAAIKYMDWMVSDPTIIKTLQNGELGKHYLVENEDGIPIQKIPNEDLSNELKIHWHDFSIMVTGSFEYGSQMLNAKAQAMSYPGFEDYIIRAVEIAYTDAFIAPRFDTVIESEAKYTSTLNAKGAEIFVKSIMGKPEDFDATYDSLVKEYLEMGGQQIIDEKLAAYKAMKAAT
jgi:putative aldouronate transport system substrate-binding protein